MSENITRELKILENAEDDILADMSSNYFPLADKEVSRIFSMAQSKYKVRKSNRKLITEYDITEVDIYTKTKRYKYARNAAAVFILIAGLTGSMTFIRAMKKTSPDYKDTDIAEKSSAQIVTVNEKTSEISQSAATTSIPKRTLEKAVAPESATKEDIFYMMLNTIFYFDKVSGTVMFNTDDPNAVNVDDFQCSLSDKQSYSDFTQCYITDKNNIGFDSLSAPFFKNIRYCNGYDEIDVSPKSKAYRCKEGGAITIDDVIKIPDESRISTADDGMPLYNMLTTPTNVSSASMCIQPQEITFGFLSDFDLWNIEEITKFSDRTCYVINGKASAEYGASLNVADFKLMVDVQTGVILQYEGYDSNGNISNFMYTKDLQFEDKAKKVRVFDKNDFPDYAEKDKLEY